MSQKSSGGGREAMADYPSAKLGSELLEHVAEAISPFRGVELEAVDVGEVLFHYSLAAKELWKFSNIGDVEIAAVQLHDGASID